jgi:hypothetical protein
MNRLSGRGSERLPGLRAGLGLIFGLVLFTHGLAVAGAEAGAEAVAPEATLRYAFDPGVRASFRLEFEQSVHVTTVHWADVFFRDQGGQEWTPASEPELPSQAVHKAMQVDLVIEAARSTAGVIPLGVDVAGFDMQVRMGENELAPVGADEMDELRLRLNLSAQGPLGPASLGDQTDLDASNWPAMQPLAEAVRCGLQLGLPTLPSKPVRVGDTWSASSQLPAAIPGSPGLVVHVWSFFIVTRLESCGSQRCLRVDQILQIELNGRKPLGGAYVDVALWGGGKAEFLVPMGGGFPLSVKGELTLEAFINTGLIPGLPPAYGTHLKMTTRYGLLPVL